MTLFRARSPRSTPAAALPPGPRPWQPFAVPAFAAMWSAALISNTGTWMQQVAAAWLMTSLDPSPLMVSLVQAATTAPMFVFVLAAGAVADMVDRRRLLLVVQSLAALTATTLALLVHADLITPWLLLGFCFALGTGFAFHAPAWQAVVPHLVPRAQLPAAIALNSIGFNVSRTTGPAIAGWLIGTAGIATVFLVNGLSFLGVIAALSWCKLGREASRRPQPERFLTALATGLRFGRDHRPLRAVLVRATAFFLCASAYWALLPLVVRVELDGGPEDYGVVLGSVGAGAVVGAALLPRLRQALGVDRLIRLGTLGTMVALLVFALLPLLGATIAAAVLAGFCWVTAVVNLNVSAHLTLPEWVRGRGLSLYQMTMFGSLAAGSVIWGRVGEAVGVPAALSIAAAGALVLMLLTLRWRLDDDLEQASAPSGPHT